MWISARDRSEWSLNDGPERQVRAGPVRAEAQEPAPVPETEIAWMPSQEVHDPLKELLCPPSWVADADFMCLQEAKTVFKHKIIMIRCLSRGWEHFLELKEGADSARSGL